MLPHNGRQPMRSISPFEGERRKSVHWRSPMDAEYRAIDADGHVIEPPGMWQAYIEEPFKSQAPRSVGAFSLLLNDKLAPKREGTNRVVYGGEEAKQLFLH